MIKRIFAVFVLGVFLQSCASSNSPQLAGEWAGTLSVAGQNLRLVFHISESSSGYTTEIESVDQGGVKIPSNLEVDGNSLKFWVEAIQMEYNATVEGDVIIGDFKQFGISVEDFKLERRA
ncbi:MAG: hypothetical protein R3332_01235 [Pseudohongiellaceae bacterium]|nr:hypothetical protein [Pseudohongiellaceae bacterium]